MEEEKLIYVFPKSISLKWNVNKVGDPSRGRPEGSLFNSYDTEV